MQKEDDELDMAKIAEIGMLCPLGHLRMATRVITQMFDELLQPSGVRATQFGLLGAVALFGPATITKLAEKIVMDRTTLTRNLRPLEDRGLIKVAPGEDRRTRELTLTPLGEHIMARGIPLWDVAYARVAEELGEQTSRELLGNLKAVVALAQAR